MLQLIIQLSTLLQMPLLYTIVQSMIITNSLTPFKPKFKGTIAFLLMKLVNQTKVTQIYWHMKITKTTNKHFQSFR